MESPLIVTASGENYEGIVAVDSVVNGTSSGGVRIAPDITLEEVCDLAREMTMKFSLFRLPRGGAKAGLRIARDLDASARRSALESFGGKIGPIVRAGLYNPGMDMNCGPADLQAIYAGAGVPIGLPTDTSLFTAIGESNALFACAEALAWRLPVTVAIEGFGSVGRHLARLLPSSHFRITAISTIEGALSNPHGFSHEDLIRGQKEFGDGVVRRVEGTVIPLPDLTTLPVDVLVPSARTRSITESVAGAIRCKAVIPVANAPYRGRAALALHERDVLCLPGYLCNAGGVFGSSMADSGVPISEVERFFESRYRGAIRRLVERCAEKRLSPVAVVDEVALRQAEVRAGRPEDTSLSGKLYRRIAHRYPRALKRREMTKRCDAALAAIESDFSRVGE